MVEKYLEKDNYAENMIKKYYIDFPKIIPILKFYLEKLDIYIR